MSTSGNRFSGGVSDIVYVDGMIISNGAYLTSLGSALSAFGSSGSILNLTGVNGYYTPTASDADGDGETDEIFSDGTIIRPFDGIDYEFDPNIYITLDPLDFTDLAAELTAMFEGFCNSAQAAIDTLKNDYGVEFNLSPKLADNTELEAGLAMLAYALVNYGDLSVSNSLLSTGGGVFALGLELGDIPISSTSLDDILSGAGNIINVYAHTDDTFRADFDPTTVDPNDRALFVNMSNLNGDIGATSTFGLLIHEFMHFFNLNGNVGPWDVDDVAGYHIVDYYQNIEHNALDTLSGFLSFAIQDAVDMANDPFMDAALYALDNCGLDFG